MFLDQSTNSAAFFVLVYEKGPPIQVTRGEFWENMRGLKIMSWFYIIFFLSFTIWSLEARDNETLQSAVVVGTVYCDTCFQEDFSKPSHFISGSTLQILF